jgi:L-ascorbate metabolism protein UlaG (beta-lactamase superfamily)
MPAPSDHFDGRRFLNPTGANGQPFRALPRLFLTPKTRWPRDIPVQQRRPPTPEPGAAVVTFLGHASFLIHTPAAAVLIDPVYSRRAGPFSLAGPRRSRAPGVRLEDLPPISHLLVSHNHYDHCDLPTLRWLARRFQPQVVTPLGNGPLLRLAGLTTVAELDWWEATTAGTLPVTVTPAQHFSARTPFDRNAALWGGFLLETGPARILFAGDSGYGPHFREIGSRLPPIELALLPIGAYEPRWFMKDIHMNPAEAVQAFRDLEARRALGMHFGTFQLTPEGIDEPVRDLSVALNKQGVRAESFRVLEVGESLTLG